MPERWIPALLAVALVQLLLAGVAAVTVDDPAVEAGRSPSTTVPFPPENPNPETPVSPPVISGDPADPADPGTGVPPAGGEGEGSRPLPSSK